MEPVRLMASPEAKRQMANVICDAVLAADPSAMASIDDDGQRVTADFYADPEELLIHLQMRKPVEILVKPSTPYLLVEENDSGYDIIGVFLTFEEADTAAGRTSGSVGRPHTWYRIHQMVGKRLTRGWRFSVEKQAWETHYWDEELGEWISD